MRPAPHRASFVRVVLIVAATAVAAAGCGSSSSGTVRAPGAPAVVSATTPSSETASGTGTASDTGTPSDTSTTSARSTTTSTRPVSPPTEPPAPTTTATPPPLPTAAPTTTPPVVYLRAGDEGPEVSRVQELLARTGYLGPGYVDGVFDRATNRAVLAFQGDYGLIVDGVVGPETRRSLRAAAASITG